MSDANDEREAERQRTVKCATEIEKALIATLDDLQAKLMEKYKLPAVKVEYALACSTFRAAVDFAVRNSDVPDANVNHLLNHILFMVQGCRDSWTRVTSREQNVPD